jgi:predicted GIY-YIG superfamily endonuclease
MKTYIYTLAHPETGEIRYVGKTTNIKRRYYQHTNKKVSNKLSNKHLSNWLLSILNKHLKPILNIV